MTWDSLLYKGLTLPTVSLASCNLLYFKDNCLQSLIKDYISYGSCAADYKNPPFNGTSECIYNYNGLYNSQSSIEVGTCSTQTEELLKSRECGFALAKQPDLIFITLELMLYCMCNTQLVEDLMSGTSINSKFRNTTNTQSVEDLMSEIRIPNINSKYRNTNRHGRNLNETRIFPIEFVTQFEDATIVTNINANNTRHRYPWICSLRSKTIRPKHYCAVTLFSRPPGPTVLVGPAHCTDLCKSSRGEVDNCCCGGPNNCSDNISKCGSNPKVVAMTGQDAEILCGEWETGDAPQTSSGEKYNIFLSINEIKKHPNYTVNINSSAYIQNDIAVFKVDSGPLNEVRYHVYL